MNVPKQILLTVKDITVIEGRNPRQILTGIEDLAASIEENGVIRPINVEQKGTKNKTYELIDGHRRVAACQMLADRGIEIQIPAMLITGLKSEADVLVQMLTANDSVLFEPIEEAVMLQRMQQEFGLKNEDIAKRIGKSASYVADRLALLRAHPVLQEAVTNGEISTSDANTIIRKSRGDVAHQQVLAERVMEEGREQVIEKELKKGRMPKIAWEAATQTYDHIFQASVGLQFDSGLDFLPNVLTAQDPIVALEALKPQVTEATSENFTELAFSIGKLAAFATLSSLPMGELWNKIAERANYGAGHVESTSSSVDSAME